MLNRSRSLCKRKCAAWPARARHGGERGRNRHSAAQIGEQTDAVGGQRRDEDLRADRLARGQLPVARPDPLSFPLTSHCPQAEVPHSKMQLD